MPHSEADNRGFFDGLIGDGRCLLTLTGLALVFSGMFALFLSARGEFLPHDVDYLGMNARDLCAIDECRVVHFMFHDRVSFGGTLIAIGALYMWLAEFPLRRGEAWSWWSFVVSGGLGFASFLTYLGYGYLDSWHGVATLVLLPVFAVGLFKTHALLKGPQSAGTLFASAFHGPWLSAEGMGRLCLLGTSIGLVGAGLTIMTVGMTRVFVPQDLEYMRLSAADLHGVNPRLVPLIAHDRAGFGGGLVTVGTTVLFCVWCGGRSRSLWQALTLAGIVGFSTAIGVHPAIGYTDFMHLAPAYSGALLFATGLVLSYRPMVRECDAVASGNLCDEMDHPHAA